MDFVVGGALHAFVPCFCLLFTWERYFCVLHLYTFVFMCACVHACVWNIQTKTTGEVNNLSHQPVRHKRTSLTKHACFPTLFKNLEKIICHYQGFDSSWKMTRWTEVFESLWILRILLRDGAKHMWAFLSTCIPFWIEVGRTEPSQQFLFGPGLCSPQSASQGLQTSLLATSSDLTTKITNHKQNYKNHN